eukprot:TRINITY_DN34402_c0_g1_i2.p1 TRINITY_DN34402_c0_g1~~TRINITY_DN34402_c0_g1_i2.p1  ORF type:complete len:355 (-),score=52.99 TRINITY_DN34402_c0_g1_i2:64-1128(-)
MACTSKRAWLGDIEVIEYDFVEVKVSWKGALYHTPGIGEEEMAEFDAGLLEKQEQRTLSQRTHRLLALGRAAEMRASVLEYLAQDSRLRLPDVVARTSDPRRARRSSVPPQPRVSTARSGRPAPRARERNMAADSHAVRLSPVANATGDADTTSSEAVRLSKFAAMADASDTGSLEVGDKVDDDGDASSLAGGRIERSRASSSHLTEWTSDGGKTFDKEPRRVIEHDSSVSLQNHLRVQTPQNPSEVRAEPTPTEQLPLSPVPPCNGMYRSRPPPPHRNRTFLRNGNPHASSESIQESESDTGVHLDTLSSRQQLPEHAEHVSAEEGYGTDVDTVCAKKTHPPFARLPPRPSSA